MCDTSLIMFMTYFVLKDLQLYGTSLRKLEMLLLLWKSSALCVEKVRNISSLIFSTFEGNRNDYVMSKS